MGLSFILVDSKANFIGREIVQKKIKLYWEIWKYDNQFNEMFLIDSVDFLNPMEIKVGNGLIVKTKVESFFRCISLIMPLLFASDDKPREAYHIPLKIDAVSHYYTFVYIPQYSVCIPLSSHRIWYKPPHTSVFSRTVL